MIKSKSMLQEECGMTPYLQRRGIEVTESDLGERIQQLSAEPPSHMVVPAIHKLRTDVAELFAKDLGTDAKNSDPHYLAEAMRENARPRFMAADAGMTGGNFAIAETGAFVVCTNEGTADIGASVPPLHALRGDRGASSAPSRHMSPQADFWPASIGRREHAALRPDPKQRTN